MKIYFGASISFDRSMLPMYRLIVDELKKQGHEVVSEYVVDPKLETGDGLDAEDLFSREVSHIELADAMVAEVTKPSWGTAFLIEHALSCGKPVLALFYGENKEEIPLMIAGHPELYEQHYDEANVGVVLEKSLEYFADAQKRRGKLVVIDGANGAGKSTQREKLLQYFKTHKIPYQTISFPRYKTSFHGKHVGRFLKGEFGGNDEISPYLSSLAFALDRLTSRHQILEWLKQGYIVVADRYVSASMAHQGGKLTGTKQQEFLEWIYDMEYKEHKLPKEDIVIYLQVPAEISRDLLKKSGRELDQEDVNIDHNRRSIVMYQKLSKKYKHWVVVECVDETGKLMTKQQIHEKIIGVLKQRKILK
jgi:dTMP kinase